MISLHIAGRLQMDDVLYADAAMNNNENKSQYTILFLQQRPVRVIT